MIHKLLALVFAVALVPLAAPLSPAWAQNTGSLAGHVYDQSGLPLRGVEVTATSDTQIGGGQVAVTNDEGGFRLQGLFPGRFKLRASAPKLKTLVQEKIFVAANTTTEIDLVLEVESPTEEIQIVQKAPIVNLGSTKVGTNFDEEFMSSLPLATRDYQGVAALTPGVSDSGGGNPTVRGGTYFSNNYTVDGFNTTDPVTNTFGTNFSFSSMANVEVTTAGGGSENAGTSGGTINVVTKSGSNRFELDTSIDYMDQRMEFFKDSNDRGENRIAVYNLYVGGPLRRDVLWYAVSGQFVDNASTITADPNFAPHPSYHVYGFDGTLKLTWRLTQRNQIDFLGTISPASFNNLLQDPLVEAEAEARQYQRSDFLGLTWQYIGEVYLQNRLGFKQQEFDVGPQRCQWDPASCAQIAPEFDVLTGVLRKNYTRQTLDQRLSLEVSGNAEWIKDTKRFGDHAIKLTWFYQSAKRDKRETVPGDAVLNTLGSDPFSRSLYCSNDPMQANGMCNQDYLRSAIVGTKGMVSLSDAWKPTRYLTIKPGGAFHYGDSENDRGVSVTNITAWTPHLALLWDPTRDGKTKLSATIDGIVDTGFLALAGFTSRSLYSQRCNWDPKTMAYSASCRSGGGSDSVTVGLPCGPSGVRPDGTSCRSKLNPPRVWEATIGGEREIATGIAVGATFIYKKFNRQWEDAETNANWNEGGTELRREGPYKTGRSQFIFDLQTPEESSRLYRGVTVTLKKREGRLKGDFAYTLAKYEGTVDSSYASGYLDNPAQSGYFYGPLGTDNRHDLRAVASYEVLPWLSMGVNYRFRSGGPYNRYFFDPVFQDYSRFQAQRGFDSRGDANPDNDTELRMPDISQLGLQGRASLERIIKHKVEVWADMLNVLGLRTPVSYVNSDGPNFGRVSSKLSPTRVRVGLRYRY